MSDALYEHARQTISAILSPPTVPESLPELRSIGELAMGYRANGLADLDQLRQRYKAAFANTTLATIGHTDLVGRGDSIGIRRVGDEVAIDGVPTPINVHNLLYALIDNPLFDDNTGLQYTPDDISEQEVLIPYYTDRWPHPNNYALLRLTLRDVFILYERLIRINSRTPEQIRRYVLAQSHLRRATPSLLYGTPAQTFAIGRRVFRSARDLVITYLDCVMEDFAAAEDAQTTRLRTFDGYDVTYPDDQE